MKTYIIACMEARRLSALAGLPRLSATGNERRELMRDVEDDGVY